MSDRDALEPTRTVLKSGVAEWRLPDGNLHRDGGPAVEYADGTRSWYSHGRLHRLDGPAAIPPDGPTSWWVSGRKVTDGPDHLDDLYQDGEIELLTHVLSVWQPDGPTIWQLIKAVRAAHH